ncbi:MAG: M14 family metallopeptidase [Fidelibacterota bacterium]
MNKKISLFFIFIFLISTELWAENQLYHYHTNQENHKLIKQITKQHKEIMKTQVLTETKSGRKVSVVEITGPEKSIAPTILIVGGLEGDELTSTEICMDLIKYIAANYHKNEDLRRLLRQANLSIIPQANPEAQDIYFENPVYNRKTNHVSTDDDLDGIISEDPFNDLNGDGIIAMMRVEDLQGDWIVHKDYPVMKKWASKDSLKTKYSLYTEGLDDDKDGQINEDPAGGVDINSNYPYNFNFSDQSAGTYALSQQESRAIADYIFEHRNIVMVYAFTGNNNLTELWPATKNKSDEYSQKVRKQGDIQKIFAEDQSIFKTISKKYKTHFSSRQYFDDGQSAGNFPEWVYYHTGRISLTTPAWRFPMDPNDSTRSENKDIELYKWLQRTGQRDKFLDWQQIDHPDFPGQTVEIGGFHPYCRNNAPEDSLKQLCEAYRPFVFSLCEMMPRIDIAKIETTGLHDHLYRVEVFVQNNGQLPTATELGTHIKWVSKIRVNMDEKAEIISGKKFYLIDKLDGNGGIQKLTWLIKSNQKKIAIKLHSPVFGDMTKEVTL